MNNFSRALALIVFITANSVKVEAQELTFFKGNMHSDEVGETSFSWQLDYRQDFYRYLAGSVSYLNEGHVTGHHRDGTAWQGWLRLPLFSERFNLSAGAGAYYYYDTQFAPTGDTANVHGTALIYSVNATVFLYERLYCSLRLNRVEANNDIRTDTAALGLGFWFGQRSRPFAHALGDAPDEKGYVSESELTIYGGQSVVNTFLSESAVAYAVDFRHGILPHLDWNLSYIYEGDPKIIRRSGVATQLWVVNSFSEERVTVGFGVGPYLYLDHKHPVTRTPRNPGAVAPLISLTISTRLSENWVLRGMFHRVTSNYNRDSDIFLLGVGYRWRGGMQSGPR